MVDSKKVREAFDAYLTWRMNLIEALLIDSKSFRRTLDGERYYGPTGLRPLEQWEVNLCDDLLPGLPPSTMPLNFTCDETSEYGWLFTFTAHCDAWLLSVALNSKGLGKNDRCILFRNIINLPKIHCVVPTVVVMKGDEYEDEDEDEDETQCELCPKDASCVFWIWCGTCKKDTILYYCDSCSKLPKDICESCGENFAKVVRCP